MKKPLIHLLFGLALLLTQSAAVHAQKPAKPRKTTAHRPLPGDNGGGPTEPLPPGELFVGTWEWADAGEVFHLTLVRNSAFVLPGYPNDPPRVAIIGQFVYTRNGVVVDQSLTTGRRPFAALGNPTNNRSIEMQFYESGTRGWGALKLTFQPNNPDVLDWSLQPVETVYRNPADRPAVPLLVPRVMTLTRQ